MAEYPSCYIVRSYKSTVHEVPMLTYLPRLQTHFEYLGIQVRFVASGSVLASFYANEGYTLSIQYTKKSRLAQFGASGQGERRQISSRGAYTYQSFTIFKIFVYCAFVYLQ